MLCKRKNASTPRLFFFRTLFFAVPLFSFAPLVQAGTITSEEVVLFTNIARVQAGLPALFATSTLQIIAQGKADDLRARHYFAHKAPSGEEVADLAERGGYPYLHIGENLALGEFTSAQEVVDAWLASEGHRKNILSPTFSEIGVGLATSTWKGVSVLLVVQTFGLSRSVCPSVEKERGERIAQNDELLVVLRIILDTYTDHAVPLRLLRFYNDKLIAHQKEVASYNEMVVLHNTCIQRFL